MNPGNGTGALNPENIPPALRDLIPLAERWDIGDDFDRDHAISEASVAELRALVTAVTELDGEALEGWLAGPAAADPNPTPEYLAFSNLLMAFDLARLDLAKR
jgi:hypothetical protein